MSSEFNHLPVNWVDGMKISRKHFQETEEFINEQIIDTNSLLLNGFNFGILPGERSLYLDVQCDFTQQIAIEVTHCNAVTPNGTRIFVRPADGLRIATSFKEIASKYSLQITQSQLLYILISVNPFERVPTGEPFPDENPPRHPYSVARLHLDIIPAQQIRTRQLSNVLLLGKINYENGELLYQREYIPPCTSVDSLPVIRDWYNKFQQQTDNLEGYAMKILEKIRAKGQSSALINGIYKLSEKIIEQVAQNRVYYRWMIPSLPPAYMCETQLRLLQQIHTCLRCFPPADREEVINYFTEWTDIRQGTIDTQVAQTLQSDYDHYNLYQICMDISLAYSMFLTIFEKMVQLEYIGKHKGDSKIFIEQKVEIPNMTTQPAKSSRWSPLD